MRSLELSLALRTLSKSHSHREYLPSSMFCLASEISSKIISRWKTSTFTSFKSSDCKSDLFASHTMICMDMVDVLSITPEESSV